MIFKVKTWLQDYSKSKIKHLLFQIYKVKKLQQLLENVINLNVQTSVQSFRDDNSANISREY